MYNDKRTPMHVQNKRLQARAKHAERMAQYYADKYLKCAEKIERLQRESLVWNQLPMAKRQLEQVTKLLNALHGCD